MKSTIRFNIDEVFAIAEKTEANGIAFYKKAASLHSGKTRDFLLNLAGMEKTHLEIFADMRAKHTAKETNQSALDPYSEALLYINSIADAHGGEGALSAAEELTGKESLHDIVLKAIKLEEKSIILYSSLRELVPEKTERDIVDKIISEEKSHIVTLAEALKNILSNPA